MLINIVTEIQLTVVMSVNRPTFVSPLTTNIHDIPRVEVMFLDREIWPSIHAYIFPFQSHGMKVYVGVEV